MRYLLFVFLFVSCSAQGQFSDEYLKYKSDYHDDDKVRLTESTFVTIKMNGDEVQIDVNYNEQDLYLNKKAAFYTDESISYSTFYEVSDVKASSLVFNNGKYKELKVKDFTHKDELSGSVFHDDRKSINFKFQNLEEGGQSFLTYDEKIKNPRFLKSIFFKSYCPIIKSVYQITVEKGIELSFKEFYLDQLDINFTKVEKGNNVVFRWEVENIDKHKSESSSVSYRSIEPHIVPFIESYTVKGERISVLKEPKDLYAWYYDLVKDINPDEPSEEFVELVHSLVDDKETELEKVKAIYYWTQDHIKYVAFEYALGGFIPRNANDIFNKKYGDCKDNSSIIQEMFKIADIKGYLTWIGTRDIPYSYSDVPTPVVDNHMILAYKDGARYYFLDATGRYLKFGLPSSFIQGKEALIGLGDGEFTIQKVPVIPAEENFLRDSTQLYIDNAKLNGSGEVVMNGYQKLDYYNVLEGQQKADKINAFYTRNFRKGNNKFIVTKCTETNKFDYEADFKVNYEFNIDNYVVELGDEIYVNLNLSTDMTEYRIDEKDKYDKEFEYKNMYSYVNVLNIPNGYSIDYFPENISIENEFWKIEISYELKENQLIYRHLILMDFIVLKQSQFKAFNQLIQKVEKQYKESIVLKKN